MIYLFKIINLLSLALNLSIILLFYIFAIKRYLKLANTVQEGIGYCVKFYSFNETLYDVGKITNEQARLSFFLEKMNGRLEIVEEKIFLNDISDNDPDASTAAVGAEVFKKDDFIQRFTDCIVLVEDGSKAIADKEKIQKFLDDFEKTIINQQKKEKNNGKKHKNCGA